MASFDAIVAGVGAVGSAALGELARRGRRVLGIDRFAPGHDRGSSHGQTRIIRQAYFEHPEYVPLLLRAYELWHELEARRGETFLYQTGLIQLGTPSGEVVAGVLASARQHGLAVELLSRSDLRQRFPYLLADPEMSAVLEPRAGYLRVEACVEAQAAEAVNAGAKLCIGETLVGWRADGHGVEVETDRGRYRAAALVLAAGAWAGPILADLSLPLVVRRKPLYWYRAQSDAMRPENGCPAFLYETADGIFYGFPDLKPDGVKVAEHTGGTEVQDPLRLNRDLDPADQARVEAFVARYLPAVSQECTAHATCMYTLSPDGHFIVDRHPAFPQVVFAAGLSGHGFKFAPVLGAALADLALEGASELPIDFLSLARLRGRA